MTQILKGSMHSEDSNSFFAGGYIDYIQTSKKDDELVEVIWVVFADRNVGKKCYKGKHKLLIV